MKTLFIIYVIIMLLISGSLFAKPKYSPASQCKLIGVQKVKAFKAYIRVGQPKIQAKAPVKMPRFRSDNN
jgi:hypothetical protein